MKVKNLPQEIRELWLLRAREQGNDTVDLDEAVVDDDKYSSGFVWKKSKEGHKFWYQIYKGNFKPYYDLYANKQTSLQIFKDGVLLENYQGLKEIDIQKESETIKIYLK